MKAPSIVADSASCRDLIPGSSGQTEELFQKARPIPLDSILDSLDEGVIILDRRGVILKANPAFCQLFTSSAAGLPAASVIPGSTFREMLDSFLHDFLPERHASPAFRIALEDETVLSVRITPLKDASLFTGEDAPYAVAVFHDISDLIRMSRRRKEFMGEVAHELRTPLTTIVGFAETILDLPPHHTEDRQKFTGIILRSARHMSLLVEDMLRLSRLESGNVPLQLTCVRAAFVLEDALDACASRLEQKRIETEIHIDRTMNIRADAHYVTQVFRNLLENACRYSPEGGIITICGERSPFESMAVFSVADQGPGVPEQDCERVFERFYRVEKERVSPHSTGLGLAICKHIVERHGGVIRAEKGPGGMFIFTVPLAL
ncbi:ATP-binding protein [uncultured Mailhella sp.]|uniref:sensor histidine kinase n=1 Tax=uncultured Mailhella sp. TaxID=1981031 RepID=UPI00262CBF7C|nr:ATP-binding protein [uncultured Mailhella sp.]